MADTLNAKSRGWLIADDDRRKSNRLGWLFFAYLNSFTVDRRLYLVCLLFLLLLQGSKAMLLDDALQLLLKLYIGFAVLNLG